MNRLTNYLNQSRKSNWPKFHLTKLKQRERVRICFEPESKLLNWSEYALNWKKTIEPIRREIEPGLKCTELAKEDTELAETEKDDERDKRELN